MYNFYFLFYEQKRENKNERKAKSEGDPFFLRVIYLVQKEEKNVNRHTRLAILDGCALMRCALGM